MIKGISVNPELVNQAVNLVLEGRVPTAARLLRTHLRNHPTDLEALHEMSFVLSRQEKQDEAFSYTQRALDLAPNYVPALLDNVGHWLDLENAEEALATV